MPKCQSLLLWQLEYGAPDLCPAKTPWLQTLLALAEISTLLVVDLFEVCAVGRHVCTSAHAAVLQGHILELLALEGALHGVRPQSLGHEALLGQGIDRLPM